MNWYLWQTPHGQALACAGSIEHAREQLQAQVMPGSAQQRGLDRIVQDSPRVLSSDRAFAMFSMSGPAPVDDNTLTATPSRRPRP